MKKNTKLKDLLPSFEDSILPKENTHFYKEVNDLIDTVDILKHPFTSQRIGYLCEDHIRYKSGDKSALFTAIYDCAMAGLPLPEWVTKNFISGYHEQLRYRSNSWDEIFGTPHPSKTRLGARRRSLKIKFEIYDAVQAERYPESQNARSLSLPKGRKLKHPIDPKLFEDVGKRFNISGSLAKKLYYEAKHQINLR